ncbi:MAG: 16S rRNA (guanine(966)-N(2))-methyltransferase RsmD, partial [Alphaproteobacteria bacterium]
MRIIAGRFKGRRLFAPRSDRIRPTTDRMRETLFNLLTHGIGFPFDGARAADIFAGTGALGLEALSRGASHVTFVENHPASLALLADNVRALECETSARILRQDARRLPTARDPFDLVFLDPPYNRDLLAPAIVALQTRGWLKPGSIVVAETEAGYQPAFAGFTML